jgi:hypothetical protein
MAKAGRKSQEMRHVSFRMPADVHRDYVAVAESRGVDLSALLNWVVVEHRPVLLLKRAENEAAMLRAAVAGPQQDTAGEAEAKDELARVNDLIRQLQALSAILLSRARGGDSRWSA